MKNTIKGPAAGLFSLLICSPTNEALSMKATPTTSKHRRGRRAFISQAAGAAGFVGAASVIDVHTDACVCIECSSGGVLRPRPANAIEEEKRGKVDNTVGSSNKKNSIEYAFEAQAIETNARLAKGGFALDTKQEEEDRIQEGLASFSYDAAWGGKKGMKPVSKGYGKNR